MAWIAPVVSAVGSIAGTLLGNKQSQDYNSWMSGSAYQRATRDMIKAGLNPMLAYSQGGASSPQMMPPNYASAVDAANNAATGSSTRSVQAATAKNIAADTEKKVWDTQSVRETAALTATQQQTELMRQRILEMTTGAQIRQANADAALTEAQIPGANAEASMYSKFPWLKGLGSIGQIISSAGGLKDLSRPRVPLRR